MVSVTKRTVPDSLKNEKFKIHFHKFQNNKVKASNNYYAAKDVKEELGNLYNNKCAYCETIILKFQIEHYRPQSKYKYLTYEWTNLMPVCCACNQSKSNKFPVKNNKIIDNIKKGIKVKSDLKSLNKIENPYIINPEIDNPNKHFNFTIEGEIKAKTERAKKTIDICDLNSKDLILKRQKSLFSIKQIIDFVKYQYKNTIPKEISDRIIKVIEINKKAESEYSLFWQNVAINLENLMLK